MTLSWTQDRLGPMCRYAEDCAMVMSVIARPDGHDMSVSEIPFNWNARLDIRKLRVGILQDGFDEVRDSVAKKNDEAAIAQVEALGYKLVPVKTPEGIVDAGGFNVESAAFFDEMIRGNGDAKMTNPGRAAGFRSARLIPGVEYLQGQRARTMAMMKLAEATADVDVYLVPANAGGGGGGRGAARGGTGTPPATPPPDGARGAGAGAGAGAGRGRGGAGGGGGATQRHFSLANVACYPAINVVNGFTAEHTPTALTFYARPFGERELLAFAKAYQDASGFHLKHPELTA